MTGNLTNVAPYMGAWIEIYPHYVVYAQCGVAPYMGAWIEILALYMIEHFFWGRSLHGSVD